MHYAAIIAAVVALAGPALGQAPPRNDGTSWPTLHGDLERAGFYPRFPRGPYRLTWRKELWREMTGPRAEVIVGGGLACMGTYAGRMHAWDAATGAERWTFATGGPIGHSPMYAGGVLYFGSMDRNLYAVRASDGKRKWRFEAGEGIWTSPVVWKGLVLFGARDGVFYALRERDGRLAWRFQTGDRILAPASISEDGRRVFVASEDMRLYCLDVAKGTLVWRSRKLAGLSLRDYAPVVERGVVMVTTNPVKDFHAIMGEEQAMLVKRSGYHGPDERYIPGTPADAAAEQQFVVDFLKAHPSEQVFYAFDAATGKEPWIAPLLYTGGLHNPLTPPCYDPTTGETFTQVRSAYTTWDGGSEVRPFTGVGQLDVATGRVALLDHGYRSNEAGRPAGRKDMPWGVFNTIGDETQTLSCSPDRLFSNHQGTLSWMDRRTGLCDNVLGKRDTYGGFYGPGVFGWENQGGEEKARQAGQPYAIINEWHGPARAIASVAGRCIYYAVGSQVLCMEGNL